MRQELYDKFASDFEKRFSASGIKLKKLTMYESETESTSDFYKRIVKPDSGDYLFQHGHRIIDALFLDNMDHSFYLICEIWYLMGYYETSVPEIVCLLTNEEHTLMDDVDHNRRVRSEENNTRHNFYYISGKDEASLYKMIFDLHMNNLKDLYDDIIAIDKDLSFDFRRVYSDKIKMINADSYSNSYDILEDYINSKKELESNDGG